MSARVGSGDGGRPVRRWANTSAIAEAKSSASASVPAHTTNTAIWA